MMSNSQDNNPTEVNTGGGASVGKNVATEGGHFVGRDVHIHNYNLSLVVIMVILLAGAIILYGLSDKKLAPTPSPTQMAAIVQPATPTATEAQATATIVPPTKTPELLPIASPLPAAEAKPISATLTVPASSMPTETPVPLATSTLVPPTSIPTSIFTPEPTATTILTLGYPCLAEVKSSNKVQVSVYRNPFSNSFKTNVLSVGKTVQIREPSKGYELFYHIWSIEGTKSELGWIAQEDVHLSPTCPQ